MKFDMDEYVITAMCGLAWLIIILILPLIVIVIFPFWCVGVICKKLMRC